ncbi:Uridine kinase-like protein 4 [Tetrabaena socialis]|uniref:Uridine kinase-like protein 4 n=1 Tax=Tetrabaena socialis TaxID=47790 RepID=A0A2J8AK09_9CHLO|nr:Uridine kinase-like protein 4 [Tetrabaena socialis]|eukprot:PNH12843.1 Uridine kinase-like protein 4 [Tetrabaena socialis]
MGLSPRSPGAPVVNSVTMRDRSCAGDGRDSLELETTEAERELRRTMSPQFRQNRHPFLIGVSGGTASGKTTVCDRIMQRLHDQCVVMLSQDSFYRTLTPAEMVLAKNNAYNFDHPDALDRPAILHCLTKLKEGRSVEIPIYDFALHSRVEETRHGKSEDIVYEKLPSDIARRYVLLMDPVLGTGNTACKAIQVLLDKGVQQHKILFLCIIAAPPGVHRVCQTYPGVKVITSEIDTGIDDNWAVIPGVGEFGDRYYC